MGKKKSKVCYGETGSCITDVGYDICSAIDSGLSVGADWAVTLLKDKKSPFWNLLRLTHNKSMFKRVEKSIAAAMLDDEAEQDQLN